MELLSWLGSARDTVQSVYFITAWREGRGGVKWGGSTVTLTLTFIM